MLDTARYTNLDQLAGRLHQTIDRLICGHFSEFSAAKTWSPAVNAYRLADRIEVCVELAGVDRESIQVTVDNGRLLIRGFRQPPEPPCQEGQPVQILAMEIDYGPFERGIALPKQVDAQKIAAEHRNGLLWIRLPLKPSQRSK